MDCAGSNTCSTASVVNIPAPNIPTNNSINNTKNNNTAVCSTMTTAACQPATHQSFKSTVSTVCLSTECASVATPTPPPAPTMPHQQPPLHSTVYHNVHDALTCTIPHQNQHQHQTSSTSCSNSPASSSPLSAQQPTDDCCTPSVYTMADFCCTPVEHTHCCALHSNVHATPQPDESGGCCTSTHTPVLSSSGYDLAAIECCIIESALREGMDSSCCQDVIPPGEALLAPCCAEHPDVIDECCPTCCPDSQRITANNNSLATPMSVLNSALLSSSSSSSSGSTCNTTPSTASSTISASSAGGNYFGFQQSSAPMPSPLGHLRNDVNLHSHRHWMHHRHHSHVQSLGHPQQRGSASASVSHYHTPASLQLLNYSSDILTPPLLSEASSQASSLQVSPETKQLEDAQLDHMIKCLWTGCTAEFMSQDDLLPHVEQHLPGDILNDHPFCQWESCATELLDWDTLIQHLQEDHHILDAAAQEMSGVNGTCETPTSSCTAQPSLPSSSSCNAGTKSQGCHGHKTGVVSSAIRNHSQPTVRTPTSVAKSSTLQSASSSLCSSQQPQSQPQSQSQSQPASTNSEGSLDEPDHVCRWKGCGQTFESFDALTTHLSEDHIGTGKSEYQCEWEGCERNGRLFSQRQKAMRHIQTHTGDKPYQCQICRKRFSEANIMAQHMRTHTGEKPFKCNFPGCGREFSISGALTIHKRVHTGEKPFKCKFEGCNKWFAESSNLTKHLRVHTGERPFKCPFPGCGKSFSRPDQVTRHKRTHMTEDEKLEAAILSAKHGSAGNGMGANGAGAGSSSSNGHHNDANASHSSRASYPVHHQQLLMPHAGGSTDQERPSKRAKTDALAHITV